MKRKPISDVNDLILFSFNKGKSIPVNSNEIKTIYLYVSVNNIYFFNKQNLRSLHLS